MESTSSCFGPASAFPNNQRGINTFLQFVKLDPKKFYIGWFIGLLSQFLASLLFLFLYSLPSKTKNGLFDVIYFPTFLVRWLHSCGNVYLFLFSSILDQIDVQLGAGASVLHRLDYLLENVLSLKLIFTRLSLLDKHTNRHSMNFFGYSI